MSATKNSPIPAHPNNVKNTGIFFRYLNNCDLEPSAKCHLGLQQLATLSEWNNVLALWLLRQCVLWAKTDKEMISNIAKVIKKSELCKKHSHWEIRAQKWEQLARGEEHLNEPTRITKPPLTVPQTRQALTFTAPLGSSEPTESRQPYELFWHLLKNTGMPVALMELAEDFQDSTLGLVYFCYFIFTTERAPEKHRDLVLVELQKTIKNSKGNVRAQVRYAELFESKININRK